MLDPRDLAAAEEEQDDVGRFAAMSPEQRLALFLELCEVADSIVRYRPDAAAIRAPTPRSEEAVALWHRLMERARRGRR